jgi:hypothetical protein
VGASFSLRDWGCLTGSQHMGRINNMPKGDDGSFTCYFVPASFFFCLSRENQIAKKFLILFLSDLTGCVKHTEKEKENQMTGTAQKFVVKMKNKNLL